MQRTLSNGYTLLRSTAIALVALCALPVVTPCAAQELPTPRWWFGIYGGANINLYSGLLRTPSTTVTVSAPEGFTTGSGLGLSLGALLEYNSGGLLGGNLMIGYDNRAFDADPVASTFLSATPAYITIEPNARINLGGRQFHLTLGPSVAINVASSFEYIDTSGTATTGDLADVRGLVVAGQAGVGYDIPLSGLGDATQVVVTPFAQARLGQGLIDPPAGDNDDVGITSIRLGVALKLATRLQQTIVGVEPARGAFDIALRVPDVITDSRVLRETFPMRNYIFFDAGSTDLPARYTTLTPAEAAAFREEQLAHPSGEPGGASALEMRSRQQMQVYYNVLNVLGDRMRKLPSTTVRLVGAAAGDAEKGRTMAENVKRYLVDSYRIDAKRITTEGQAMPPNRSGSGSSSGEDAKMIAAENHRVTIIGSEQLTWPLDIQTVQEEPIGNDVVITIPTSDEVAYWSIDVTGSDGVPQRYGPFRGTSTARIAAKPLLGAASAATFRARGTITMHDGSTMTSGEKEFRLERAQTVVEKSGTRYSILFEFDESKTVETYESFLARTVAPSIPNGATVIIHGHTDLVGAPEYNAALAQRRVDETQKILTRELTRAGKTVTFDTYGFGEDETRAPFDNILPEQRYYNRTVVVEVVP